MRRVFLFATLSLSLAAATAAVRAEEPAADAWAPFRRLEGTWSGEARGFGGVSDVQHVWSFVISDHFMRLSTRSVQRGNGEVHEDVGYLSRDTDHDVFVFRQFLSEGFVNTYVATAEGDSLLFAYREAESAGGMKAQLRFRFTAPDAYDAALDLSNGEGGFAPCQVMHMKRVEEPVPAR